MKYMPISLTTAISLACAASSHLAKSASTVQGFDISHHQNYSVDFEAAYTSGARFVVIKATEGNTWVDDKFNEHTSRAADAGFIHGAYHFANPASTNGSSQALFFLAKGGKWKADGMTLPGWLDLEAPRAGEQCYGLSQSDMIAWITGFVDTYSGVTGRFPMIYTTNNWWTTCTGNYKKFSSYCPLVLARYNTSPGTVPGGWTSYTIWQNSEHYFYGGDSDIFNGDESALLNLASGTTTETTFPATVAESAAQRVLRNSQHVLSGTSNVINIASTLDSLEEMPTTADDPWNEEKSLTFRDGSVSLLCFCGGGSVNLVTLPWRLGNILSVTNAYKKHGTRPDPETGRTVDFYAGVGSGGVHMHGGPMENW
ncbi:glycoside hydrolase [Penicillium samsonianum]|uniref:glycoside hydrolase n=1 Tax=Penicillium samsonianum TaxID=1882272 RepID=UPI002547B1EB|nr:glycoside hydrolase [Penicillium samsonianum]KAJ6126154.1 glycoside hydrolase [Penicillium samsonianum]